MLREPHIKKFVVTSIYFASIAESRQHYKIQIIACIMHAIIGNIPCLKQCVDFLKWGNFVHGAILYIGQFLVGHFLMGHFLMGQFSMGHYLMGHLSFGAICHVIS